MFSLRIPDLGPDANPLRRRTRAATNDLLKKSLADQTRASYANDLAGLVAFLVAVDEPADLLPSDMGLLADYLASLSYGLADDAPAEDGSKLPRRLQTAKKGSTIAHAIAAINKAYRTKGLPEPGKHPYVAATMASLRRDHRQDLLHQMDALELDEVVTLLRQCRERSYASARDAALVFVLAATPTGDRPMWGTERLGRVTIGGVTFGPDNVTLEDALTHKSVTLVATGEAGCPVAAVRALLDVHPSPAASTPLFGKVDGNGELVSMESRGLRKAARRLLARVGASDRTQVLSERQAARIKRLSLESRLIEARDAVIIAVGAVTGLRGGSFSAVRWGHWTLTEHGLILDVPSHKGDPTGEHQSRVFVPYGKNPRGPTCPVGCWRRYHDLMEATLGADPLDTRPDEPWLTGARNGRPSTETCNQARAGDRRRRVERCAGCANSVSPAACTCRHLKPIRTKDIGEMLKRRTALAGIKGNFGAHSLRATFCTLALDGDASYLEVAEQSLHATYEMVMRYDRKKLQRQAETARKIGL